MGTYAYVVEDALNEKRLFFCINCIPVSLSCNGCVNGDDMF